ncbi:MAG: SDR family NAD(P)-dependent oxidoreductase [Thermoactinospora sp.]|nr:SDR family NAD(P)-dependent oxidoreductase [Thermoactinospora sp.]
MGTVLVTGATGGIGTALVGALTEAGHRVIAIGRDIGRLDTHANIRPDVRGDERPDVRGVEVDLASPETLVAAVETLRSSGELDDLRSVIHCAGISPVESVAEAGPDTWRRTMAVNVASAAELVRLTLPALRRSKGHVIFVNASPGLTGVPRWSAFVASKAALRELADSLREEEAPNGVRVTTIYPAATATDLLGDVRRAFNRPYDPESCIQPKSLATMIVWALSAPPDAYPCDLSILPSPR